MFNRINCDRKSQLSEILTELEMNVTKLKFIVTCLNLAN